MNEIRISDPAELQLRLLANTKDQAKIIGLNLYKESYKMIQIYSLILKKSHKGIHRIDQPE